MDASRRVLMQFRIIANAMSLPAGPVSSQSPVVHRNLRALDAVAHAPGLGVNALASALGVPQPMASQAVKALVQRHLIKVERNLHDRRAVRLYVSEDGRAVLGSLPAKFDFGDRLAAALRKLDEASQLRLESGLSCVARALARPWPQSGDRSDAGTDA